MNLINHRTIYSQERIEKIYEIFPNIKAGGVIKFKFSKKFQLGTPTPYDNIYHENRPVYLSICAIFKDEAPYLKEWIEYHLLAGVERFYLYDNDSTDNPLKILQPYIDKGVVTYHKIPGSAKQFIAYRDAIYKYKKQTYWMAIIDLDEFIVPVEKDDIKEFLKDYEKYPGVAINWQMFDSNNYKTKPNKLLTEAYTRISKEYGGYLSHTIKSIVKPKEVEYISSAHWARYKKNKLAVYSNYIEVPQNTYGVVFNYQTCMSKIKLNHYYTKSEEEYLKRCSQKNAIGGIRKPLQSFLNFCGETEEDLTIQKYLPKLKERLKN